MKMIPKHGLNSCGISGCRISTALIAIIMLSLSWTSLAATESGRPIQKQTGDYPSWPAQELDFQFLDAQIETGFEQGVISGEVSYRFRAKHPFVNRIRWAAPGVEIIELKLDEQDVNYELQGDTLHVLLNEYLPRQHDVHLRLRYRSKPVFGVHFLPSGTMFSSSLPGSTGHWLPGPVTPRARTPFRLTIHVPAELEAVTGAEPERVETTANGRRFIWVSEEAVPFSELRFAAGDFEYQETFYGLKNIRIYQQRDLLSREEHQELLEFTIRHLRELERTLRNELPAESLQIVILDDDRWELRPYTYGMAIVFTSMGNLKAQIARSIAAQWFGVSMHTELWQDATFTVLLQAYLAEQTDQPLWTANEDELAAAFEVPETFFDLSHMTHWQWARYFIRNNRSPVLNHALSQSLRELSGTANTLTAHHLSEIFYDVTGKWFDAPLIGPPEPEPSYHFLADAGDSPAGQSLSLDIQPLADITNRMFLAHVIMETDNGTVEREITFSGQGQNTEVRAGTTIRNFFIRDPEERISFEVGKPFSYWLYQLRNHSAPDVRIEAAVALKNFTANPDLELALIDLMNREEDPEVLAAMYRVMSAITAGASGTEQRFFDGLTSGEPQIALTCMKALTAYRNNNRVTGQVLSVIQSSDNISLVNEAITTYRHLLDSEAFRDFAIQFLREDREELLFTRTLLKELFQTGVDEPSVQEAREYLDDRYPFDIRWLAYLSLRTHGRIIDWEKSFLENHFNDPDPRIRFLTFFSLSQMEEERRRPFLKERMMDEYDIRILRSAQDLYATY